MMSTFKIYQFALLLIGPGWWALMAPHMLGLLDTTFLATLPNMVVIAAANELELAHMDATAAAYDAGPISFRYPRGEGVGIELPEEGEVLKIWERPYCQNR